MSPESYGETPINPMWSGDKVRDRYEIELFHEFVTQGKPVFGICRGHQLINVALGGTLYQDIATQCANTANHRDPQKYDQHFHEVRILPQTWLARLYSDSNAKRINSIHHQAIKIGTGQFLEFAGAAYPSESLRQRLHGFEADVVARADVLLAWVSQADDQFHTL